MSMWAQHGWGKTNKLRELAEAGLAAGTILSPASEERESLVATRQSLRNFPNFRVAIDPQGYIHSIPDAVAVRHDASGLTVTMRPGMDLPTQEHYINALVSLNDAVGTTATIAPSPLLRTFNDRWFGLSMSLTQAAIRLETSRPVWGSLIVSEEAFDDPRSAAEWLDEATSLELAGYYMVAVRTRTAALYPKSFRSPLIAGQADVVRRLTDNGIPVVVGYADLEGLVMLAVGASGIGSGWSNRLRFMEAEAWQPQGGGGPPRRRLYCPSLLTPLLVDELSLLPVRLRERLVPPPYAEALARNSVLQEQSQMSYLIGFGQQCAELSAVPVRRRREVLTTWLDTASAGLEEVRHAGVNVSGYQARIRNVAVALGYLA